MRFLKSRWLLGATLILLGLLLSLALLEFGLRLLGLGSPLIYHESLLYGYALRPNQKETRQRNAIVTINEKGLRSIKPWAGKIKILFLGDSVTYGGSYIDDRDTFAERTCELLNQGIGRQDITCGNAGTNAYGVRNVIGRLKFGGLSDSDVVVVTLISADFYRGFTSLRGLPFFTRPLSGPLQATMELFAFELDVLRSRVRFGPTVIKKEGVDWNIELNLAISELKKVLEERTSEGKTVLLVWSPSKQWVEGIKESSEAAPRVMLERLGFPFIDMTDYIHAENIKEIYYDSGHLEKTGHLVYATKIAEELARLGIGAR
jgi:hypothetical protein